MIECKYFFYDNTLTVNNDAVDDSGNGEGGIDLMTEDDDDKRDDVFFSVQPGTT